MIVLLLAAVLWTGMHNAPDNAPTHTDRYGYMQGKR